MKLESKVSAPAAEFLARLIDASPGGETRGTVLGENSKELLFFTYAGHAYRAVIERTGKA